MVKNWFDFHLHSYCSDGRLSPEEVIQECKKAGVMVSSLTDHDDVSGIPFATQEGKNLGIKVIPGIEFSVDHETKEHHILGYNINYQSPLLQDFLHLWNPTKEEQLVEMIEALKRIGFILSLEDVLAQRKGSPHRSHIAYALLARQEENKILLERFGITRLESSLSDIFKTFLKEDALCFKKRKKPKIEEVVSLIKQLNGVAVWAHPGWKDDVRRIREKANIFKRDFGLDGIEVGYSLDYQTAEQALVLHQIAQELSLYETAGSDFHSPNTPFLNKIANFELPPNIELNLPQF